MKSEAQSSSIVDSRRLYASSTNLYPSTVASQSRLPIERFDQVVSVAYETVVDMKRFPSKQVHIGLDADAAKLLVCGYLRKVDVPFTCKADYCKEVNIPLDVASNEISAIYDSSGMVHITLPHKKAPIKGVQLAITPIVLDSSAAADGQPSESSKTVSFETTPTTSKSCNKTLTLSKSMGHLPVSTDSARTIWDKPYCANNSATAQPTARSAAFPALQDYGKKDVSSVPIYKSILKKPIGDSSKVDDSSATSSNTRTEPTTPKPKPLPSSSAPFSQPIKHYLSQEFSKSSVGSTLPSTESKSKPAELLSRKLAESSIEEKINEAKKNMDAFVKRMEEKRLNSTSGNSGNVRIIPITVIEESSNQPATREEHGLPSSGDHVHLADKEERRSTGRIIADQPVSSSRPTVERYVYHTTEYFELNELETEI